METTLTTKHRRPTSKRRGPKTWAAAREMYQAGWTARTIAERLDLGIGNIYRRSAKEGWRKDDLPDEPGDWSNGMEPGEEEPIDIRVVARAAMAQAVKLVRQGQLGRAAEAAKAAEMIGKLAERIPDPAVTNGVVLEDLRHKIAALSLSLMEGDAQAAGHDAE